MNDLREYKLKYVDIETGEEFHGRRITAHRYSLISTVTGQKDYFNQHELYARFRSAPANKKNSEWNRFRICKKNIA